MDFMYSLFFGAGVAAIAYTQLGKRVGYGNQQNVAVITGVVFVIMTIVFLTIIKFFIHTS